MFQTPEAITETGQYRSKSYMRPLSIWAFQWAWEDIYRKPERPKNPSFYASDKFYEKYEKKLLQRIAMVSDKTLGGGNVVTSPRLLNGSSGKKTQRGLGDNLPTKHEKKKRESKDNEEGTFVNQSTSTTSTSTSTTATTPITTSTTGLAEGVGIGAGAVTLVGQLKYEAKMDTSLDDGDDTTIANSVTDTSSSKTANTSSNGIGNDDDGNSAPDMSPMASPSSSSPSSPSSLPPTPTPIQSSLAAKRKKIVSSTESFDDIQL